MSTPAMDEAIDWAAGVMAEVQDALEHPTSLVVHRGLQNQVANYQERTASRKSIYLKFQAEATRLDRPMRFLLLEWVRLDPVRRAPLFIGLYKGSKSFFRRFRGYSDTVAQMYVLTTDRRPIELPDLLAERAQSLEDQLEAHTKKLHKLEAAVVQQKKVVEEFTSPWLNLDSDVLNTKPVSLPRKAGVVHPDKVVLPVGSWRNRGMDMSATVARHADVVTPQQIRKVKPWESRKRRACSGAGPSRNASTPELRPVLGPVRLREEDEREHQSHAGLAHAAKRVRYKDGIPHVDVANPAHGSGTARRPTQDEIEEEGVSGIFEDDCMLNYSGAE